MANSSNPLNVLAGGIVALFGVGVMATAAAVLLGDSDLGPTRPFYLVAAFFGAAMALGGVQMIVAQRRALRAETEHRGAIRNAVGPAPSFADEPPPSSIAPSPAAPARAGISAAPAQMAAESVAPAAPPALARTAQPAAPAPPVAPGVLPTGEPVLARWTYEDGEWRTYAEAELKRQVLVALFVGVGLSVAGWTIFRGEVEELGFGFVARYALLITGALIAVAVVAYRANRSAPGEAILTPTAVMLNGKYHVLADGRLQFGGVRLTELGTVPVLEFTVSAAARRGRTGSQVRVPVPRGRDAEAREIVAAFERGWAVEV